jgi:3-methyladenine DNA glycosylase AlkD
MNLQDVTSELKARGTAQNIKTYRRHGAGENVYGVSFADLKTMAKEIKSDHDLALALWDTLNCDARSLATMIIDCQRIDEDLAHKLLSGVEMHMLVEMLGGCIAKGPAARVVIEKWTGSAEDPIRQCGYATLAAALKEAPDAVSDDSCRQFLQTIEKEIHGSPNRSRHSMNNAVIAIGIYKPALRDQAVETAKRIGTVHVDHGDTSCKTPDAAVYILKAAERKTKTTKKTTASVR